MQGRHRNYRETQRESSLGFGQTSARGDPECGSRHLHQPRGNTRGQISKTERSETMIEAGRLAAEYLIAHGFLPADCLVQGNVSSFSKDPSEREIERSTAGNGNFRFAGSRYSPTKALAMDEEDYKSSGNLSIHSGSRKPVDDPLHGHLLIHQTDTSLKATEYDLRNTRSDLSNESLDDLPSAPRGTKKLAVDVGGAPKAVDSLSRRSRLDGDSDSELENYEFPDAADSRDLIHINVTSQKKPERVAKDDNNIDFEARDSVLCNGIDSKNTSWPDSNNDASPQDSEASSPADANKRILNEVESRLDESQIAGLQRPSYHCRSTTRNAIGESHHDRGYEQRDIPFKERRIVGNFVLGRHSSLSRENLDDEYLRSLERSKSSGTERGMSRIDRPADVEDEIDPPFNSERNRLTKSYSFAERSSFMHQQESPRWPPGFGGPDSMDAALPNERVPQYARLRYGFPRKENRWEATRRHFSRISQAEEYFHLHNLKAKQMFAQAKAKSQEGTITAGQESVEVEKDLMNIDSDIAVMSKDTLETDSVCQEEQDLVSVHSESSEEKLDHSRATTETMDDSDASISERLKACAEIALFALHNSSDTTQTTNTPGTESVIGSTTPEEGIVHSFFQKLFTDFPSLRKLYQSQDSTKGFDCLVCLSLSPANETKHESLLDLLEHVNSYTENTSMHKGYGSAIFEINGLGKSNSLVQFGGDTQLQTNLSFENQEV
eukprot:TRINITY_DN2702_c0_g1_i5.p1 TRINITY_DN2702_c0_g1~~TRINITY_DN2702_c0_g1_i5.p1  ORF type:complete len:722 (-),score=136.36 TRINITY_DN2702_c0_g1_i5:130-2295(-)